MKKILIFLILSLVFTLALQPSAGAKSGKHKAGAKTLTLKHLENLYFISQDLDENAALMLKPEKGCFCSCRDAEWVCTDMNCDAYLKKCENPPPEEGEAAQMQSSFDWQR